MSLFCPVLCVSMYSPAYLVSTYVHTYVRTLNCLKIQYLCMRMEYKGTLYHKPLSCGPLYNKDTILFPIVVLQCIKSPLTEETSVIRTKIKVPKYP